MADRQRRSAELIAGQIVSLARREGLEPGARLIEQRIAEMLGVSRGPIRAGLQLLATSGVVVGVRNRGYALAKSTSSLPATRARAAGDRSEAEYYKLAEDRLEGRLPQVVTESELMRRYDLSRPDTVRLLERVASEGWIERLPGNGWRFASAITNIDAYANTDEFRRVIEPAAMRSQGYELPPDTITRLRAEQVRMIEFGIEAMPISEIFRFGAGFHEGLASGAPNPFYLDALKRINSIRRLFVYRSLADRARLAKHVREHLVILDLIERGDHEAAAQRLERHLTLTPAPKSRAAKSRRSGLA